MAKLASILLAGVASQMIAFGPADAGTGEGTVTSSNPALVPLTDPDKLDALSKAFPSQQVVGTYAEALAKITKASESTDKFYGLPIAVAGYDPELDNGTDENGDPLPKGGVDESIYNGMFVRLGTLATRVDDGKGTKRNGVKAITVIPVPMLDAILSAEGGRDFMQKVLNKEMGLVAYRNIRDAATENDLLAGMAKSPTTVEAYLVESKRAGSAGDTETFDALWKALRQSIKETIPALYALLPSKVEVIKAIRSKVYALNEHNELETASQGSIFVMLAQATIASAKVNKNKDGSPNPLDTSAIEDWLAERDTLELKKEGPRERDFSTLATLDFGGLKATETESQQQAE